MGESGNVLLHLDPNLGTFLYQFVFAELSADSEWRVLRRLGGEHARSHREPGEPGAGGASVQRDPGGGLYGVGGHRGAGGRQAPGAGAGRVAHAQPWALHGEGTL